MTGLVLEPYAIQQHWSTARPLEASGWAALFGEYLSQLASACAQADVGPGASKPVIGHIKLVALFDGQEYLRVSVVSAAHPPTITGQAPPGLAAITVTLNVLVYGLPREYLAALTSVTVNEVAERWRATVSEQAPAATSEHPGSGDHPEDAHHVH
jgi:hypothetical protein